MWTAQSSPGPFHRLLEELSEEYDRVVQEVHDLTQEIERLSSQDGSQESRCSVPAYASSTESTRPPSSSWRGRQPDRGGHGPRGGVPFAASLCVADYGDNQALQAPTLSVPVPTQPGALMSSEVYAASPPAAPWTPPQPPEVAAAPLVHDLPMNDDSPFHKEISAMTEDIEYSIAHRDPPPPAPEEASVALASSVLRSTPTKALLHNVWVSQSATQQSISSNCLDEHALFAQRATPFVSGDAIRTDSCLQSLVIHPNGWMRLLWDLLSVVTLIFDICWIPFQVFDPPTSSFTYTAEWWSTAFWSVDLGMSFLTGYHENSLVEMRLSRIARHYASNWFLFDMMVLLVDWLHRAFDNLSLGGASFARIGKSLRLMRVLRSIQFLRIMKLQQVLSEMMASVKSEYVRTCLDITAEMAFLMVFSHFIACGWFYLGTIDGLEDSWVVRHLVGTTLQYKYTTALHWAVTQFTLTSTEIFAANSTERIFSICVLFVALLYFSCFVSSITTAMAHMARLGNEARKTQVALRQYFYENAISVDLANRIMLFLGEKHYANCRHAHMEDLAILRLVPEQLLQQLHMEVFMKQIEHHPFFWQFRTQDAVGAMEVCHLAMSERPVDSRDVIFTEGKLADCTLFVHIGEVGYIYRGEHTAVKGQSWMSEAAIFVKWWFRGKAVALTSCELASLDVKRFRHIIGHRPEVTLSSARHYADMFATRMLQPRDTPFNDLPLPFDEVQEMAQMSFEHVTTFSNASRLSRTLTRGTDGPVGKANIGDRKSWKTLTRLHLSFDPVVQKLRRKRG